MVKAQVVLLSFILALVPGCGAGNSVKNTGDVQSGKKPGTQVAKQTKATAPGSSTRSISLDELLGDSDSKSVPKKASNSGSWKYYTGPDGVKRQDISGVEWVVLEGGKGKSLTQAMVGQKLRRYVIKGSFDLGGKTIRMPYGSVLDLESGSLTNGALVFDDTRVTPVYAISKQTKLSRVKVSGTYYETLVDLWGATEEPLFPWDTTAPKRVYTVDLKKFGITPGYQKKGSNGHYSDKQYDLMYNNGVGFTNAIQWAYKNGYDGIRFPKNDYCFTPRTTDNKNPEEGPVILVQDIDRFDIDLGGSSSYLVLDSKRKSKYYSLNRDKPFAQGGSLYFLAACINLQIHNGFLVGDRKLRDYDDEGEKAVENSCGINISAHCHNIRIHHLDMQSFMADGIICWQSGGFWKSYEGGYQGIGRVSPGKSLPVAGDKDHTTITDCFLIKLYSNPDYQGMKVVQRIAAQRAYSVNNNLGYTRLINPYHNIEILTYNAAKSSKDPLRTIKSSYLETIILNWDETNLRIKSSYDEGAEKDGLQHSVTVSELISSDVVIEKCRFTDNHRGGISGGSNTVTIRDCIFQKHRDMKNYAGSTIPLYLYGGTNYHIDFEDSFAKDLVIYGCSFSRDSDAIGKILLGVYTVDFHDNVSDAPVCLYNNVFCDIHDNYFSSSPLWLSSWRHSDYDEGLQMHGFKYLTRVVYVHDNVIGSNQSLTKHNRTVVYQSDNRISR